MIAIVVSLAAVMLATGCSDSAADAAGLPADAGRTDIEVDSSVAPRPLGTVRVAGSCAGGAIPSTECMRVEVDCPGAALLGAQLRVTRGGGRGTIVLGSGGTGETFFEEGSSARSLMLTAELVGAGFTVVRRAWDAPGWFAGSNGVLASSCRYASLLRFIDEELRAAEAPFCAVGLSGGAIEVAYALSRWDAADRLRGAILLAGPSISRLDWVCPSVAPARWRDADCRALADRHGIGCGDALICTLQDAAAVVDSAWAPERPCTASSGSSAGALAGDGTVSPDARVAYPSTSVEVVVGDEECGATALLFYDAITSTRRLTIAPRTGHDVTATDEGIAATRDAIRSTCASF